MPTKPTTGIRDYPSDDDPVSAQTSLSDVGLEISDSLGKATLTVTPPVEPRGPRGADALRALYGADGETPGEPFSAPQATESIAQRGWMTPGTKHPTAATRAALQRLKQAGEIEALGGGRYRFVAAQDAVTAVEEGVSF